MKQIVTVTEVQGEGLEALLGKRVTLYCANYIYTGKLEGVNDKFVKLSDAGIVYETGEFKNKQWANHEPFPQAWYVVLSAVESYGELK